MSTVLEVADIRKTFGGLKAVDGLGLTIKAGEVAVSYTHLTLPTTPYV